MGPNRWARLAAVAVVSMSTLSLAGCISVDSLDDALNTSMSHMVAEAQDVVWDRRDGLAADPEAALPTVWGMTDARQVPTDPGAPHGSWQVLDVVRSDQESTLTLVTSAGAATGGGWMYQSKQAYTCFSLTVAVDAIETEPAECDESIPMALFNDSDMTFMPLDQVAFRPHVDSTDHPAPICQCYSGSPCDCPGG